MKLIKGAQVFSSLGEKIGSLDRIVLNPDTKKVTHLVVEKGTLFTVDKLIPIQYVNLEVGERITLDRTAEDLKDLPDYDPSSFINIKEADYADQKIEKAFWYPSLNYAWWNVGNQVWYPKPQYVSRTEHILPEGTVGLDEGAQVVGKDGKDIGSVERVIVEPTENVATHIVVRRGMLIREYKLVPTLWITDVAEEKVYLSIDSDFFEHLPEHELAP